MPLVKPTDPLKTAELAPSTGLAILPDHNEADNAEKTARWRQDEILRQGKYAKKSQQGLYQAALRAPVPAYAGGGKPETAEELMARIQAKYGASSQPTQAPQPQPAPVQQKQPPAPQPGGLLQKAAGLIGNRGRRIDEMAGYACGGKPMRAHANGGKITGPGTPTSDSIPAKVAETGEDILVSTDERILSAKQEALLLRIAKALGFETVEQLLEAGTGEPVGPTIKSGKRAAYRGGQFGDEEAETSLAPLNGQSTRAGDYPSKLSQWLTGATVTPAAPNLARGDVGPSVMQRSIAADLERYRGPAPAAAGAQPAAPANTPPTPVTAPATVATPAPAAQPLDFSKTPDLVTKDIAPGGYLDRGAGILAQRGKNGQLNVANVGTGDLTDPGKRAVDDSASALIDQKNSTYNPARQLENMQRLRLTSDATDPSITDPRVREQAIQGLAILNAGRAGADTSAINQENLAQARINSELRGKLLDPSTPPEERARILQAVQAIHGKADTPAFDAHVVKGQIGEPDTLITYDKRSGRPVAGGTGAEIMGDLRRRAVPPLKDYAEAVRKHPRFAGQTLTDAQINQMYQATYGAK